MSPEHRYRAVSLDLWSTCLRERPGSDTHLQASRLRFLRERLKAPGGDPEDGARLEQVLLAVDEELRSQGKKRIEIDPTTFIQRIASKLGSYPSSSFAELSRGYTRIGLTDHLFEVNPEAESLIAELEARQVPTIALTNTARPEETWQEYFCTRTRLRFGHVVTSCEVGHAKPHGAIFTAAARRLNLDPADILHVGDWWQVDGRGALNAGFGAVLYTGLWETYPALGYPRPDLDEIARAGVPCIRRLDDPLLLGMLA